jgi:hypothetical protein
VADQFDFEDFFKHPEKYDVLCANSHSFCAVVKDTDIKTKLNVIAGFVAGQAGITVAHALKTYGDVWQKQLEER